jgi:hypothetical protein
MLLLTLNTCQERVILRFGKWEGHRDETATLASTENQLSRCLPKPGLQADPSAFCEAIVELLF